MVVSGLEVRSAAAFSFRFCGELGFATYRWDTNGQFVPTWTARNQNNYLEKNGK
jgi:hypothetical protein